MIQIKRIYEPYQETDGIRYLVDRVWPRGIKRTEARLDGWLKELAPSTALRKWFAHIPGRFPEFVEQYRKELEANPPAQAELLRLVEQRKQHTITLLYGAKDQQFNQAAALKLFLDEKIRADSQPDGLEKR